MFKFLFGGKSTPEVVIEADRDRFTRLVDEINAMIDGLGVKPKVTVDPETGHIELTPPEQFADEALALPAPDPVAPVAAEAAANEAARELEEGAEEATPEQEAEQNKTPESKAS